MKLIGVVVALCIATNASAQTGPRTGGPAPGDFKGTRAAVDLSLTGNAARGVADRDLISFRGSLTFWRDAFGVFVQPYYMYGDVKLGPNPRIKTDDERYLRALLYYTFHEPLFVYGVAAFDHSLRRKLDKRALAGGGAGVTVINRPGLTFLAAVGLLYERAYYDGNTLPDMTMVPPHDRKLVRTSLRLYGRYKLAAGHINLVHDIYLIPAVRDFADLRALFSGVLEVPIVKGFAGRIAVDATHEGHIVSGTEEDDIAITFGVSYKNDWTFDTPPPPPPPPPTPPPATPPPATPPPAGQTPASMPPGQ